MGQMERRIWLRSTSLRLDTRLKICKEAIRQMLLKLDLPCRLSSWHLLKKRLVPLRTFIIHGQRRLEPKTKIILSVSVDLSFHLPGLKAEREKAKASKK